MKKFFNKKTSIGIVLFTSILLFAFSGSHPTSTTGGYTGAPNDSACTQCHTPGGNLDGTIAITGLPAFVNPNETYPLTMTISDTSPGMVAQRAGFQMVSLKANLANGGTFSNQIGETNTQPKTANGKSYIGHQPAKNFPASNVITYNVDWTAPTSADGDITIYGASMIVNGANGNSGDKFIATSVTTTLDGGSEPLSVMFTTYILPSCFGFNDGQITAEASGGTGNYDYLWDTGETTATAIMLDEGLHSVTVTDGVSMVVETIFMESPSETMFQLVSQTDAICNNTNTGTAEVAAENGNLSFNYDWGNGITGPIQNNLNAGNYEVTATDNTGCSTTLSVTIGEPSPIVINTISIIEPSCTGDSDGLIAVEATGGTGGFTYNWLTGMTGTPNGGTISDLPAGNYLVEVFDTNGCSNEAEIFIGEPEQLEMDITTIDVSCQGGTNGSATASTTGGTGSYTYSWSNGGTGTSQDNYEAGSHTVTVMDQNECSQTLSFEISEPMTSVTAAILINNQPNCGNADGSISALGDGGTPDYTFLWEDGTSIPVLSNIPAGIYSLTVTDANGCTATTEQELSENEGITLAANNVINNTCFGESNGSASISASGGQGMYEFSWSNGGTNPTESNLPAGTYTISVTDSGGCNGEITIEITEPEPFTVDDTITNISCAGMNDGMIVIASSGGTGLITYAWNIGATNDTITNLVPGIYSVVLTDELGCNEEFEFVIEEPESIVIGMISTNNPNCSGDSTGMISIESVGGIGEHTYLWNTGDTTQAIENLEEGDYTVSVTDENNCTVTKSFTLDDPSEIIIDANMEIPSCPDSDDGSISVIATGGTPDYSYLWDDGSTDSTLTGVTAGEYIVIITDMNGCELTSTLTLDAPLEIEANISSTDVTENGADDGTAIANPTNGIAPYSFLWSTEETTDSIGGLSPGVYTVSITDAMGCQIVAEVVINNGDCNIESTTTIENISCYGEKDGSISIDLNGAVEPIIYEWSDAHDTDTNTDLAAGTYSVSATDANGCLIQIVDIEIEEPDSISASEHIIVDASSSEAADGSITIDFFGGTGSLSIQYTDANGELIGLDDFENLEAGSYGAIVTDENECVSFFGPFEVGVVSSTFDLKLEAILYPVPAQNFVMLKINKSLDSTPKVFNYTGQNLDVNIHQKDTSYEVDVSSLTNGVYYIKLASDEGIKIMKMLIAK